MFFNGLCPCSSNVIRTYKAVQCVSLMDILHWILFAPAAVKLKTRILAEDGKGKTLLRQNRITTNTHALYFINITSECNILLPVHFILGIFCVWSYCRHNFICPSLAKYNNGLKRGHLTPQYLHLCMCLPMWGWERSHPPCIKRTLRVILTVATKTPALWPQNLLLKLFFQPLLRNRHV